MLLIELGVSHLEAREEVLLELFDMCEEIDKNEDDIKKRLSDIFFNAQLNCFMNGIQKCIEVVSIEFSKNNWKHDFINLDKALGYLFELAKDEDVLFNSAEELADIAKGYITYMQLVDIKQHSPEFIEELSSTLLQFLDNSYLLGLTDCRSLYHALAKYHNTQVEPVTLATTLDGLFQELS